jgi:hypothetical protein
MGLAKPEAWLGDALACGALALLALALLHAAAVPVVLLPLYNSNLIAFQQKLYQCHLQFHL